MQRPLTWTMTPDIKRVRLQRAKGSTVSWSEGEPLPTGDFLSGFTFVSVFFLPFFFPPVLFFFFVTCFLSSTLLSVTSPSWSAPPVVAVSSSSSSPPSPPPSSSSSLEDKKWSWVYVRERRERRSNIESSAAREWLASCYLNKIVWKYLFWTILFEYFCSFGFLSNKTY